MLSGVDANDLNSARAEGTGDEPVRPRPSSSTSIRQGFFSDTVKETMVATGSLYRLPVRWTKH